jgi:hypothetical protein
MNMSGVASNPYSMLPPRAARVASRFRRILLALVCGLCFVPGVHAAEVGLGITFSPEAAHMIRDWRRAHGLPQGPEAAETQAPLDSSNAVAKAIRASGLQDATHDDLVVAASHFASHWLVTIHVANTPDNSDYVIEVADAVANSLDAARKRS